MHKVLLIIQREYLTRVRKKSFIVMIFVVPLLILAMGAMIALVAKDSNNLSTLQIVTVVDDSKIFVDKFRDVSNIKFVVNHKDLNADKAESKKDENISTLIYPRRLCKKRKRANLL
jgi:ABC-2 type transport system permease protein